MLLTKSLSVVITGELLGEESAQEVAEYFAGTSQCGSGGVLIPGCEVWQNVSATSSPNNPQECVITAQILAYDEVPADNTNGYAGDLVTPEFVESYILGAENYLLGQGDIFWPDSVLVTSN